MTLSTPQPGDWVHILGKVVELHPNDVDLGIEVFSKTDQYTAFVRRDLCTPAEKPIADEPGPGSVALLGGIAYQILSSKGWSRPHSKRFITWAELNKLGDVEVIHHG